MHASSKPGQRWLSMAFLLLVAAASAAWAEPQPPCETKIECVDTLGKENLDALLKKDVKALTTCADALRGKTLKDRCVDEQRTLSHVEKALRQKGDALEKAIASEDNAKTANKSIGKRTDQHLAPDQKSNEEDLDLIRGNVLFSDQGLIVGAEKYDDYFFRLNTGYEFVAIDKFFDKGEPRVSLLMNKRLGGDLVTDDRHGFWLGYGGRSTFAAVLESSAEATPMLPADNPATPKAAGSNQGSNDTSANANVTKSFNFELQGTWIFFRTLPFGPNNLRDYLGLIVAAGGLKTDAHSKITSRFYYGLRTAINPELYADFMLGHTSGLRSNRLEVRGQFPVMQLTNGDRIFLGGIGNFAINKRRRSVPLDAQGNELAPPESDTVRVYVSFNTNLKNIFGKGQS